MCGFTNHPYITFERIVMKSDVVGNTCIMTFRMFFQTVGSIKAHFYTI